MTPEQLKASILQRAMEGKLVPQDPNDEPASELLKRIKAEKEKLIKEGKIKRDKNETEIFRGDDGLHYEKFQDGTIKQVDVPFEIPESWEWVRLKQVTNIFSGFSFKSSEYSDVGVRIIRISDFNNDGLNDSKIVRQNYKQNFNNYEIFENDILIAMTGGTVGKNINIPQIYERLFLNQRIACIRSYYINHKFIFLMINSPFIQKEIKLKKNSTNDNISLDTIQNFICPLPPVQEQKRILKKIEVLFRKNEEYKKYYVQNIQINSEFPEKLRKSILQYAMQGKLVPQDAMDEPVEVLLEKIREEKQKLFAEGKLKKKDLQESIIYQGDDNSYYEKRNKELLQLEKIPSIPLTWKYLRFNQIVNYYMGQTPPRSISTYWGSDIPWVSIADMVNDGIIYSTKEALSNTFKSNIQEKISPPNTLLMSFKLTVGKVSLLGIEAAHNEAIISIFPYADPNEIMKMYLFKFLPEIVKYGDSKDAIKGKTLNSKSINALLIPLPPLDEQKRIVDKIEKLDLSVEKLNCIQNKN